MVTTTTATSSATASCISVTPDQNGYVPEWACNANYNYYPSFGAAVVFAVLFGLTMGAHIIQALIYKKVRLCWVVIMGAIWEFTSFALRAAGARNQQSVPLAFVSQILVLLAPLWVNAFDYMVLGRMIHFFIPEKKIWGIRAVRLARLFVCLDILSFITQLGGGVLIQPGNDESTLMMGIHIYMGGIGLQEFFILVFTSFAFRFRWLMIRIESGQLPGVGMQEEFKMRSWRWLLYALLVSLVLITARIIFRLVEFAAGIDPTTNPIPFNEWYFYVFDALPMFLALLVMNIAHPGRYLVGPDSEYPKGPSRKEKKEAKRAKKEAKMAEKAEKKAEKAAKKANKGLGDGSLEYV